MGVKDLWKLLEPVGRPVSPDELKGLVLAVGENNLILKSFSISYARNVPVTSEGCWLNQ